MLIAMETKFSNYAMMMTVEYVCIDKPLEWFQYYLLVEMKYFFSSYIIGIRIPLFRYAIFFFSVVSSFYFTHIRMLYMNNTETPKKVFSTSLNVCISAHEQLNMVTTAFHLLWQTRFKLFFHMKRHHRSS